MKQYHKIKTIWKRESERPCNMIIGEYAIPEFELLKDLQWKATEKLDGMSIRVMWDGDKVEFRGKTDKALIPTSLTSKLYELFGGEANEQLFEQTFDCPVCLYGEGVGKKIQKNGDKYGGDNFVLFDVKIGYYWLKREDVEDIAKKLGLEVAPAVKEGTLDELVNFCSKGFNSQWGDFLAEGIVATPKLELLDRRGERIIIKLKYKDFKAN